MVVRGGGVRLPDVTGRREHLQQTPETMLAEEVGGDETLFDQEPAEDDAGEEADEEEGLLLFSVAVHGQPDGAVVHQMMRPEVPVGDLAVEVVGEGVGGQALLPRLVQTDEVGDAELVAQVREDEVVEDFDVGADGVGKRDVLDQRDLLQDVLGLVAAVQAAVDHAQGDPIAVSEEHEGGHEQRLVDGADKRGEGRARVHGVGQVNGKEQVGLDPGGFQRGGIVEQVRLEIQLRIRELEQQVQAGRLRKRLALVGRQLAGRVELPDEVLRGRDGDAPVRGVAEGGEEAAGGVRQGLRAEGGKGGDDGLALVGGGGHGVLWWGVE